MCWWLSSCEKTTPEEKHGDMFDSLILFSQINFDMSLLQKCIPCCPRCYRPCNSFPACSHSSTTGVVR